jgi:hypothetical protein
LNSDFRLTWHRCKVSDIKLENRYRETPRAIP